MELPGWVDEATGWGPYIDIDGPEVFGAVREPAI